MDGVHDDENDVVVGGQDGLRRLPVTVVVLLIAVAEVVVVVLLLALVQLWALVVD